METLYPMLGLALRGHEVGRAAEVFLSRRLYKRRSDGRSIHPEFEALHFPLYWHYDVLAGLKAMAAIGKIRDPRCADALELLERKRLPDGGWPAEKRYYSVSKSVKLGADWVDWGGTSQRTRNPWVTVDALAVLHAGKKL